jgi:hypothetical protein
MQLNSRMQAACVFAKPPALAGIMYQPLGCVQHTANVTHLAGAVLLQLLEQRATDQLESQLGWPLFTEGDDKLGWLLNFTTVRMQTSCMCTRGTQCGCSIIEVVLIAAAHVACHAHKANESLM